jgi:hypothetical protein
VDCSRFNNALVVQKEGLDVTLIRERAYCEVAAKLVNFVLYVGKQAFGIQFLEN